MQYQKTPTNSSMVYDFCGIVSPELPVSGTRDHSPIRCTPAEA